MSDSLSSFADWLRNKDFYSDSILSQGRKIEKEGEKRVLKLFHEAVRKVPAYQDFLRKHKVKASLVKTITDFRKVPPVTKENYVEEYSIESRCWDGSLKDAHMISTSSGTTGGFHLWPRNLLTEIEGAFAHELIFKNIFGMDKKETLLINGFAMGNWIAGTFTLACANLFAWKGYPLTSMAPGYSSEAIIQLLNKVAPKFEQTIITGHTPFLKDLVEETVEAGIAWKKLNVRLLGTGQAITENWRKYILGLLDGRDCYRTFINLYGSADAALMGFETPLSIYLRKSLSQNPKRSQRIFSDERLPSIYNFDPRLTYFEEEKGELCITKDSYCPLIRYNIHDEGGVISYQDMVSRQDLRDIKKKRKIFNWKLPFVYLFGREKFMVKIFGANIYTEHVQQALSHQELQSLLTGRFLMEMDYDESQNPLLVCRVELGFKTRPTETLVDLIQKIFIEEVRRFNSEYDFVLEKLGDKVKPRIILHEYGHSKYFSKGQVKKTA